MAQPCPALPGPLQPAAALPAGQGPSTAVASLAKNGNVYMRVHGYGPPIGCANVHVCVGNTFCVPLITWPGRAGWSSRLRSLRVFASRAWWSLRGHCFLVVQLVASCKQLTAAAAAAVQQSC